MGCNAQTISSPLPFPFHSIRSPKGNLGHKNEILSEFSYYCCKESHSLIEFDLYASLTLWFFWKSGGSFRYDPLKGGLKDIIEQIFPVIHFMVIPVHPIHKILTPASNSLRVLWTVKNQNLDTQFPKNLLVNLSTRQL